MSRISFFLTLVRHGQTEANKARIIQGQSNYPLSDHGRSQAQQLGSHFKETGVKFDLIYCSDLERALETARLILDNICDQSGQTITHQSVVNDAELTIQVDPRLRERGFGEMEGQSGDLLREKARKAGFKDHNLSAYTPPGGEELAAVTERVKDFCNAHLASVVNDNDNVLIVTHGGVVREFMRFIRDNLRCDMRGLEPMRCTPNTGVNLFKIQSVSGTLVKAECLKMHEVSHLKEVEEVENDFKPATCGEAPAEAL